MSQSRDFAEAAAAFKPGQRVVVSFPARISEPKTERASVMRTTAEMRPVPAGYVPLRFDDGGRLMVHASAITAAR